MEGPGDLVSGFIMGKTGVITKWLIGVGVLNLCTKSP